jgi:hypothetical protein
MRRYAVWLISAHVALPVYVLGAAAGIADLLVLRLTFVGAMAGAVVGAAVMQRR